MKKRLVLIAVISTMLVVFVGGPAFAVHCTVPDKPSGAGAGIDGATGEGLKEAGNSGNFVISGAFVDLSAFDEPDLFIRGPEARDFDEEVLGVDVQGFGSLPHQAHDNGSEDHGVIDAFPEP